MAILWARMDVRGNVAPQIRKAGRWAWQAYEALVRIAKELNEGGFVPDVRAEGFELAFWCNMPDHAEELEAARDRLVAVGMIERRSDGYTFPDWKAQQEPDNSNASRQKRYRDRKRAATRDVGDGGDDALQRVTTRDGGDVTRDASNESVTDNGYHTNTTPNTTPPTSAPRSSAREVELPQVTYPAELMADAWAAASNPVFLEYGRRLMAKFNEVTGKSYAFENTRVSTLAYTVKRFCSADGATVDADKLKAMGRMLRMIADPEWRRGRHGGKRDWATFSRVFGAPEKTEELLQDALTWGGDKGAPPPAPGALEAVPSDDAELKRLAAEAAGTHHRTGKGG